MEDEPKGGATGVITVQDIITGDMIASDRAVCLESGYVSADLWHETSWYNQSGDIELVEILNHQKTVKYHLELLELVAKLAIKNDWTPREVITSCEEYCLKDQGMALECLGLVQYATLLFSWAQNQGWVDQDVSDINMHTAWRKLPLMRKSLATVPSITSCATKFYKRLTTLKV